MNAKVTPALGTPTDLKHNAVGDISGALRILLADMFALYIKTKNFHWHMSGPHFRDYHLMLDEQSDQIFATTDVIAERARKIGGTTIRSIGHINKLKRVLDNDAEFVTPLDMLAELRDDNKQLTSLDARDPRPDRRARRRGNDEPARNTGSTKRSGAPGSCSRPAAPSRNRRRAQTQSFPGRKIFRADDACTHPPHGNSNRLPSPAPER